MITQSNPELHPKMRRYGCLVMSLSSIIGDIAGRQPSAKELNLIYESAQRLGGCNENCYVKDHVKTLQAAAWVMEVHLRAVDYVGKYNTDLTKWDFRLVDEDATHFIEHVSVIGAHSHFRRLCGYDPDPTLSLGRGQSIRAYNVRGVPRQLTP